MGCGASKPPSAKYLEDRPTGLLQEESSVFQAEPRRSDVELDLPIPPAKLCFFSNAGFKPSTKGDKVGKEKVNQDRGVLAIPVGNNNEQIFFAVFDGHGYNGHKISQFAAETYFAELEFAALTNESESPENLLRHATKVTDEKMRKTMGSVAANNGTTVMAALLSPASITVACMGDSRCVLGRERQEGKTGWEAVPLSVDQTVAVKAEADRVGPAAKAAGGKIDMKHGAIEHDQGFHLSMTRSLGDTVFDNHGVLSVPEITTTALGAEEMCVVLASDGLWEFVDSQETIDICFQHKKSATEACHEIVRQATKRWHASGNTHIDDITVIVAFLQDLEFPGSMRQSEDDAANAEAPPPVARKRSLVEEVFDDLQRRSLASTLYQEVQTSPMSRNSSFKSVDSESDQLPAFGEESDSSPPGSFTRAAAKKRSVVSVSATGRRSIVSVIQPMEGLLE